MATVQGSLLLVYALIAIIALVVLIARFKMNPFITLMMVSVALALAVGMPATSILKSFETGVGGTLGHIAIVVGLGTMLGKMMAESGGAERIARTLIDIVRAEERALGDDVHRVPRRLAGIFRSRLRAADSDRVQRRAADRYVDDSRRHSDGGGFVRRARPDSAAPGCVARSHGLQRGYRPHDFLRADRRHSDCGYCRPAVLQADCTFVVLDGFNPMAQQFIEQDAQRSHQELPGFGITLLTVLLPVLLMLVGSWADVIVPAKSSLNNALRLIGHPDMALLLAVLLSFYTFGKSRGFNREQILKFTNECLAPTASITLVVGAGAGFGRILIDSGASKAIVDVATGAHVPLLILAWLVAALIRVATGSATVAMATAAGIIAPIAAAAAGTVGGVRPELLVLATGAGSLILSHVNDGGFWLVKEYFGMTVPQTFKTWTVCETIISVTALVLTLGLSTVI